MRAATAIRHLLSPTPGPFSLSMHYVPQPSLQRMLCGVAGTKGMKGMSGTRRGRCTVTPQTPKTQSSWVKHNFSFRW